MNWTGITEDLITEDLEVTVDNELIRLESPRRCGRGWQYGRQKKT
jgi:hypothetical protein